MKILIINTFDIEGGAARAAYRLHRALLHHGIDSKMIVMRKKSDDYRVLVNSSAMRKKITSEFPALNYLLQSLSLHFRSALDCLPLFFYRRRIRTIFSIGNLPNKSIINQINDLNPDIVHLHWICAGMIRISELKKIKAPIVWSLHDMWAFTGGCHYSQCCDKYFLQCNACKILGSNLKKDISFRNHLNKKKAISEINNLTIVGLSTWITFCARKSSLFIDTTVINLPNLINTNKFLPVNKKECRGILGLPTDKKIILFGAMNAVSDPRKGFKELQNALREANLQSIELAIFGSSQPENQSELPYKSNYLGQINDEISLTIVYSSCDVVVVPSLQENLSNVIMESLSCGTPVVAFDIGGNCDLIDHKVNGYLAKPYDSRDLAKGIEWVLNNNDYNDICLNARQKIVQKFDSQVIVEKYIELYQSIIKNEFSVSTDS
ncbi:MAG: glycosyltransferase family 4 protein [Candidatus Cloacimonetes bacterium]|nr:glycosyltransferase family 4 protein [Candidatus Cloacimonadota bacterium]